MDENRKISAEDVQKLDEFVTRNADALKRGLLLFLMFPVIGMSGLTAVITYIASIREAAFLETAQPAMATVVAKRSERTPSDSIDSQGRQITVIRMRDILTLAFQTADRRDVNAKVVQDSPSLYDQGEAVEIFYDPDETQNIRIKSNVKSAPMLRIISSVAGTVFVASLALLFLLWRRRQMRLAN